MLMHALWDFSSFTSDGYSLGGTFQMISLLVIVVGLVAGRHALFGSSQTEPAAEAAAPDRADR